jgi:uncharacterized protein (TIRG00374 family)
MPVAAAPGMPPDASWRLDFELDGLSLEVGSRIEANPARSRISLLVRALVSASLLFVLARTVDIDAVMSAIAMLPWWVPIVALALLIAQVFILAFRWHVIVRDVGGSLPFRAALGLTFVGLFFNQTLPTSIGGDAIRIWEARRAGLPGDLAFSSVIIERTTGLAAISFVVALSLPFVWSSLGNGYLRWALLAMAPASVIAIAALALADSLPVKLLPAKASAYIRAVARDLRRIGGSATRSVNVVLLGMLAAVVGIASTFVVGHQIDVALGLSAYLVALGGAVLLTILPVSIAGWGVREFAVIGILGRLGVPAEAGLIVSLLFGVGMVVVSLPGGILWLFKNQEVAPEARTSDDAW